MGLANVKPVTNVVTNVLTRVQAEVKNVLTANTSLSNNMRLQLFRDISTQLNNTFTAHMSAQLTNNMSAQLTSDVDIHTEFKIGGDDTVSALANAVQSTLTQFGMNAVIALAVLGLVMLAMLPHLSQLAAGVVGFLLGGGLSFLAMAVKDQFATKNKPVSAAPPAYEPPAPIKPAAESDAGELSSFCKQCCGLSLLSSDAVFISRLVPSRPVWPAVAGSNIRVSSCLEHQRDHNEDRCLLFSRKAGVSDCWVAADSQRDEWIEVDLGQLSKVLAIRTQCRVSPYLQCVLRYRVQVRLNDQEEWKTLTKEDGSFFPAHVSAEQQQPDFVVQNVVGKKGAGVRARYVRLLLGPQKDTDYKELRALKWDVVHYHVNLFDQIEEQLQAMQEADALSHP
jgi:hypothetical protein